MAYDVFTLPLVGGQAHVLNSCARCRHSPGHATYGGDASFLPSTSAVLTQVVSQGASSTVVTSNLNPSNFTNTVIFTASVSPAAATGTVEFFDGGCKPRQQPAQRRYCYPPDRNSVDRHAQYHSCLQRRRHLPAEHKCGDRPGRPGPDFGRSIEPGCNSGQFDANQPDLDG